MIAVKNLMLHVALVTLLEFILIEIMQKMITIHCIIADLYFLLALLHGEKDLKEGRRHIFFPEFLVYLHNENLMHDPIDNARVYPNFPDWPLGARTANGTALCH
jgi:hypothetical protein